MLWPPLSFASRDINVEHILSRIWLALIHVL
jgi:hypothetical protein